MKDAEANAEADKKRKEEADLRNEADRLALYDRKYVHPKKLKARFR